MKLIDFLNKNIKITTTDSKVFTGKAIDYIPPQDNTPEISSISIGDYEFYENEIKSIEIVNE